MRKVVICYIVALLLASVVYADEVTTVVSGGGDTTQFSSEIGKLALGFIKVGSTEVGNLAWRPDFRLGPVGLGLDVNIALAEEKPLGYENVVLRFVEYDDGRRGLRYGVIDRLTWGHGLLMNNYSTRIAGPILLNSEQMGVKGYVDTDKFAVRVLGTKSSVYGVRLEEKIHPMLTLGQTYITDTDGARLAGTTEVQKVSGIGIDAKVPMPLNLEGFAEWAQLIDYGSGLSIGLSWGMDIMVMDANFLAEYRMLDNGFVPGYFNSDYETNPINLASAEATGKVKNGYLAQLGISAMDLADLLVSYENYNESENASFGALLSAKLPMNVEVSGYYKQPKFINFSSLSFEEGAILGGSVAYPVNPFTRIVWNYKKVYNPSIDQVEESQYYELRFGF